MPANNVPNIDRPDVHRSAKALEQIIALFHDYCQAIGACVSIQKKMSRAMKEAANVKGTHATASNAFMASSAMFEVLADMETKFSRVCEREYEGLSAELKKWFKKMAKEEKNHDEYAYSVQARIKTTTQGFEKKTKVRYQDGVADHTRYVNQLNSLTNDLAQARQAHSAYISQKHTGVLFFTGATVARLSDAEWVRSCELVRKAASVVGRVGEWRAHCEGGWTGDLPGDLVDLSQTTSSVEGKVSEPGRLETLDEEVDQTQHVQKGSGATNSSVPYTRSESQGPGTPAPAYNAGASLPGSRGLPGTPLSPPSNHLTLQPPTFLGLSSKAASSTSSLPMSSPVTPAPLPLSFPSVKFADTATQSPTTDNLSKVPSSDSLSYPFPDVPKPQRQDTGQGILRRKSPPLYTASPDKVDREMTDPQEFTMTRDTSRTTSTPARADVLPPILRRDTSDELLQSNGKNVEQEEARPSPQTTFVPPPPPPPLTDRPTSIGRSTSIDSNMSSGSHVAAMRERYGDRHNMPTSPPPRDSPRLLANSVSSNARPSSSSGASPSARQGGLVTPTTERHYTRHKSFDFSNERGWDRGAGGNRTSRDLDIPISPTRDRERSSASLQSTSRRPRDWAEEREILEDRDVQGTRRRRQESFDWDEKETTLKARQRDLEKMALELEREKDRLRMEKEYGSDREVARSGRERQPLQQPLRGRDWESDAEVAQYSSNSNRRNGTTQVSPTPRRSYSPTPVSSSGRLPASTEMGGKQGSSNSGHASSCGCHECSARLYGVRSPPSAPASVASSTRDLREREREGDRDRERDRFLASSERYASTTSLSLSGHPATSPRVGIGRSGQAPPPLGQSMSQTFSPPLSPALETKPEKRGLFGNLRRLSMPMGGGTIPETSSRVSPGAKYEDSRMTSSLGVNATRR